MYLRRMLGSAGLALAVTPQFDLVIHDEDDFPLTDQVQRFLLPAEKAVVTSAQMRGCGDQLRNVIRGEAAEHTMIGNMRAFH